MHRDGADPENMGPEDFICDFCSQTWAEDRPMVEGHRGSLICARCLSLAHAAVILHGSGRRPGDDDACTLCLMHKHDAAYWQSPVVEDAMVCEECVLRSGLMLSKDPDTDWSPPAG